METSEKRTGNEAVGHTALPWRVYDGPNGKRYILAGDGPVNRNQIVWAETTCPDNRANAAFIVSAVNAHDELVGALKLAEVSLLRLSTQRGPFNNAQGTLDVIRAALAKAGGAK